jgi:hypothetical protein
LFSAKIFDDVSSNNITAIILDKFFIFILPPLALSRSG